MGLANGIRCGGLTSSQLNDYTLAPHALAGI